MQALRQTAEPEHVEGQSPKAPD